MNNENVVKVGHRQVVNMIRQGGNHLILKVVTVTRNLDPDDTARKKGARPAPPLRSSLLGLDRLRCPPHPLQLGGPALSEEGKKPQREVERCLRARAPDTGGSTHSCAQQPGPGGRPCTYEAHALAVMRGWQPGRGREAAGTVSPVSHWQAQLRQS